MTQMFGDTKGDNQKPPIADGHTIQWPRKADKRKYNDLQNTTQKTTDWVIRIPLQPRMNSECSTTQ